MANMSYCMWENTSRDLGQLVDDVNEALEDGLSLEQFLEDKNEYERDAVQYVLNKCRKLLDLHAELASNSNDNEEVESYEE